MLLLGSNVKKMGSCNCTRRPSLEDALNIRLYSLDSCGCFFKFRSCLHLSSGFCGFLGGEVDTRGRSFSPTLIRLVHIQDFATVCCNKNRYIVFVRQWHRFAKYDRTVSNLTLTFTPPPLTSLTRMSPTPFTPLRGTQAA